MRRRAAAFVWALAVVVALATAALLIVGARHRTPADDFGLSGLGGAAFMAAGLAFVTVGALVSVRVPGNRIGPVFCLMGTVVGLGNALFQYADAALFIASPAWPGARAAAVLQNFGLPSCFGILAVAILLFPDGRLPSRRWRPAVGLAIGGIVANAVGYALRPGALDAPFDRIDNPFGVPGTFGLFDASAGLGWLFMGAAVGLAAIGSARRLRRATGEERAQLKWLALAVSVSGAGVVADVASYFLPLGSIEDHRMVALGLAFVIFPVGAGMAILRYRLYDIDVVIRRTVVYAALTATLAAAYLGSVLLLQLVLQPLTADSGLAIAASTLAVAALFRPARARIQAAVDRRFYRRRYDAVQTLEGFTARLREELDLEALRADLRAAVEDTVQPAHVSLWLRGER